MNLYKSEFVGMIEQNNRRDRCPHRSAFVEDKSEISDFR